MSEAAGVAMRPGLALKPGPAGMALLVTASAQRHEIPAELLEDVRAAVERGLAAGEPARWLEARHLAASARVERVEAWGAARTPAGTPGELPVVILPDSRFTCHGCGACCESYTPAPISEAERRRILERAGDLAPHISTPPEAWFVPHFEPDDAGAETFQLARTGAGACVFLGRDRLCEVHRRIGADRKPLVCRRFPLQVTRRPDALVVSMRVECETFFRSRADGEPLEQQAAWVGSIAAEERPLRMPAIVRVADDAYVPYPLARAVERRAVGFIQAAPSVEQGILAVRDLVIGTANALRPAPDVADLDRAEALAGAPLERLRESRGAVDRGKALEALRRVLALTLDTIPRWIELLEQEKPYARVRRENDALTLDIVRGLAASLASRFDLPPVPGLSEKGAAEAILASATGSGMQDPAVTDFVRAAFVQLVGSSRPLVAAPGLVYGYAHVALVHVLARFGARLLARRAGRAAALPADWNHALAVVDRALKLLHMAGAAHSIVALFANLFYSDDLPS